MRKSYWLYLIQRLPLEIILRQLAEIHPIVYSLIYILELYETSPHNEVQMTGDTITFKFYTK